MTKEDSTDEKNKINYTFFTKETIDNQFKEIKEKLTPSMDSKTLMKEFDKILCNSIISIQSFDQNSPEFWVYRVTPIYKGFNPDISESYSYNRNPENNGRAHKFGSPVFYGAINTTTAISEMKGELDNGQKFYLSRWKIKFQKTTHIHSLVINSETIKTNHLLSGVANSIHNQLATIFNKIPQEYSEGQMYSIEKMGDLFTTATDSFYHITSAYAHEIIYNSKSKGINIPIIIYPSVANNFNGINWAINPSFVDSKNMELEDVFELNIMKNNLNSDMESVDLNMLRKAKISEGNIKYWQMLCFKILKIDYELIQIKTDFSENLSFKKAYLLKLNDKTSTIKDLIISSFKKLKIEENLYNLEKLKEEELFNFTKKEYKNNIVLNFKNGNKIVTENGENNIQQITVQIKWIREFKKTI
jgi:hypothetical protein